MRFLALLALTCCASSQAAPPAAVPTTAAAPPSAQMAPLEFYVGSWNCIGHDVEKKIDTPLRIEVHKVLDGAWVSVRVFLDGKQVSDEFKGYDADRKKYVHLFVNKGGSGTLVSEGWTGNHMTFTEQVPSAEPSRTVFTKLSETSFSHNWEVDTGKGFRTSYEKVCRK